MGASNFEMKLKVFDRVDGRRSSLSQFYVSIIFLKSSFEVAWSTLPVSEMLKNRYEFDETSVFTLWLSRRTSMLEPNFS